MRLLKQSITVLLLGLLTVGITYQVQAQDNTQKYGEAVKAFNKALELVKENKFEQAINMYNQAITLGEQAGEQGKDVIQRSRKALPQVHYQLAVTKYKEFQKNKTIDQLNQTIDAFQQATDVAIEYDDQQYEQKASTIVTQLIYTRASALYGSQKYKEALQSADQALERNPNYAKAYHLKGKIYTQESMQNLDQAMQLFDKAIEVGQQINDNQTVRKATEDAHDELVFRGHKAFQANSYDRSKSLYERALKYDSQSADAHYRLAELSNKRQQWDTAIRHAQTALNYESGTRTDKAKIYFELGMAQKAKGMKEEACESFKNAAFGSFKAPAEHQMEYELKCQSATR